MKKQKNKNSIASVFIAVIMCISLILVSGISAFAATNEFRILGDWDKYEPCNKLEIEAGILESSIIAGKMTGKNPFVIWTLEEVNDNAKEQIIESLSSVPGVGKIKDAEFIYGDEAYSYGMKILVNDGDVVLDQHSSWALLFRNDYEIVIDSSSEKANEDEIIDDLPNDEKQEDLPKEEIKESKDEVKGDEKIEDLPKEEIKESKDEVKGDDNIDNITEEKTDSKDSKDDIKSEDKVEETPKEEIKEDEKILDPPIDNPDAVIPQSPVEEAPEIIEDIPPVEETVILPTVPSNTIVKTKDVEEIIVPAADNVSTETEEEIIPAVDNASNADETNNRVLDDQPYTGVMSATVWRTLTIILAVLLLTTMAFVFNKKDEN